MSDYHEAFTLAMHEARKLLRQAYGDAYSKQIDLHIQLVRKVMAQQSCSPGKAAAYITNRADEKTAWPFAAAMEIVDQDSIKPELN